MVQRCKFSIELKNFPPDLSGEPEPTLNELAILGGIVVLRTVLSVFLNKEIKELETENKDTE